MRPEPTWVQSHETKDEHELGTDDGDLFAFVHRTEQADPARAYRWDAWEPDDRSTGTGYAPDLDTAKQHAGMWLHMTGVL